jgi:hypothetical protein
MGMYANYDAQISYKAIDRVFGVYDIKLEQDDENGMCWMTRATLRKVQGIRDDVMIRLTTPRVPRDAHDANVISELNKHYLDIILLTCKIEEAFCAMTEEHRDKWEAQTGKSLNDNWDLVNQEIETLDLYFV